MREYAKIAPTFWTGPTGKEIRSKGKDTQLVALYLVTCKNANMIGLYYLPMPVIVHETCIAPEGVQKALQSLSDVGFAEYDTPSELVFVPTMAAWQIGPSLAATDNRVKGIVKQLDEYRKSRFFLDFYARYKEPFHLPDPAVTEAPSKPLLSQEQEQEQEQQHDAKRAVAEFVKFEDFVGKCNAIEGIMKCKALTDARKKPFATRRNDQFWVKEVSQALAKLAASDFCKGGGEKGWRADVDWFLRPDTVAKLIEGKFDNRNGHKPDHRDKPMGLPQVVIEAKKMAKGGNQQ